MEKELLNKLLKWLTLICIGILGLLPLIITGVTIIAWATSTPFGDVWDHIIKFDNVFSDGISWGYLWSQHNEHRPVLFRIFNLLVAYFFQFKIELLIYGNFVLSLINLILVFILLRHNEHTKQHLVIVFGFLLSSWLIFSPIQWENWAEEGEFVVYLAITGVLLAALGIQKLFNENRGFITIALGAFLSTYSFGSGMIVWLAAIPILAFYVYKHKSQKKYLIIWVMLSVANYIMYSIGYVKPINHPPLAITPDAWGDLLLYILVYLGAPIGATDIIVSMASGLGFLVMFLYLAVKGYQAKKIDALIPWVFIVVFVLGVSVLTGIVRSGFGIGQAMGSRYMTNTVFAWISVGVMWATYYFSTLNNKNITKSYNLILITSLIGIIALALVPSYREGIKGMNTRFSILERGYDTILNYKFVPSRITADFAPNPELFYKGAKVLEKRHLGPFAKIDYKKIIPELSEAQSSSVVGFIDPVNIFPDKNELIINGWAVEPGTIEPTDRVYIIIDDSKVLSIKPTSLRPDVEKVLGIKKSNMDKVLVKTFGLEKTYGWSIILSLDRIGKGKHTIKGFVKAANSESYLLLSGIDEFDT